jgi:hypothetical protein
VNEFWTGSDLGVLAKTRAGAPAPHRRPLGLCLLLHAAGAARRRYVGRNIEPCGGVNPWRFRPYTAHVSNGLEARVVVGQVKTRSTPFQLHFSRCLQLCPKVQKISDLLVGSAMRGLHFGRPFCLLGCISARPTEAHLAQLVASRTLQIPSIPSSNSNRDPKRNHRIPKSTM